MAPLEHDHVTQRLQAFPGWTLEPDGRYVRVHSDAPPFNLHQYFMTNPSLSGRGQALASSEAVPKLSLTRSK